MSLDQLRKIAQRLNKVVNPEPKIKLGSKVKRDDLINEIEEVIQLFEKGDTVPKDIAAETL